jgi:hypothetical protein
MRLSLSDHIDQCYRQTPGPLNKYHDTTCGAGLLRGRPQVVECSDRYALVKPTSCNLATTRMASHRKKFAATFGTRGQKLRPLPVRHIIPYSGFDGSLLTQASRRAALGSMSGSTGCSAASLTPTEGPQWAVHARARSISVSGLRSRRICEPLLMFPRPICVCYAAVGSAFAVSPSETRLPAHSMSGRHIEVGPFGPNALTGHS